MKILHYFLGIKRAGGLNRYAADLARIQADHGHAVSILYPSGSVFFNKKTTIYRVSSHNGVNVYNLIGGLPVPLLEGVRDPRMILNSKHILSDKAVSDFCNTVQPDILHIHTWMGFPRELLLKLKECGCKIVYTTHDYYGICPKVNFIDQTGTLCNDFSNEKCSRCNSNAPSERFLQIRNSNAVLACKSLLKPLVKLKKSIMKSHPKESLPSQYNTVCDFSALRDYYSSLWSLCDMIHFNSEVTAKVFHPYLPDLQRRIISISHAGITDHRETKTIKKPVRITFIGSSAPYKGLPFLLKVLKGLKVSPELWELNIWGCDGQSDCASVRYHGTYQSNQLSSVFKKTDLLIVPSIWFETFGFVVTEALSYGVPVLCSRTVGAKQMLPPEMVFHSARDLEQKLTKYILHPKALEEINKTICNQAFDLSIDHHYSKIMDLYQKIQP